MNHKGVVRGIDFASVAAGLNDADNGEALLPLGQYANVDNPAEYSPLILAYVGDAWFTLFVRCRLLTWEQSKVRNLHRACAEAVSAVRQAAAYRQIADTELTAEEKEIVRRGRNAKSHAPVKSANVVEYHTATGFEALLGHLYLTGNLLRLQEIGEAAFVAIVNQLSER